MCNLFLTNEASICNWVKEDPAVIYVNHVLAMFSSKIVLVSGLIFKSLIYFEFIFVCEFRKCSSFIILHVAV